MSSSTELDPLVSQYQHESHRPRADHAIFTLRKIASIVKPIMRRRSWRVGILAEFYPSETNLLGLNTNRGQKINLRLRYPGDANQFLPLEEVVDTMLHELCHNEIGPHNAQFHALWDQLRDEHEALVRKGYTGEGFLGRGERLGGGRIPLHEAKRRARAAAEQRRVLNAGSGQRLGGSGILQGQDPRAVIVAAIERRNRVERGCASGTDTGRKVAHEESIKTEKVTTTRAEREDQNEAAIMQAYIDLIEEEESAIFGTEYVPPSAENPAGPRSKVPQDESKVKSLVSQQRTIEQELLMQQKQTQQRQHQSQGVVRPTSPSRPTRTDQTSKRIRSDRSKSPPLLLTSTPLPTPQLNQIHHPTSTFSSEDKSPDIDPETWTCEICTLVNPINYLSCNACTVERPSSYSFMSSVSKPKPSLTANASRQNRLTSGQAHQRFERERAAKIASEPMGWRCDNSQCGNWMEQEWWTCSVCGRMKSHS